MTYNQRNKFIRLLTAGLLLAAPLGAVSEDPIKQYQIASEAYQKGRLDSAEQEYEAFLKNFGSHKLAPQAAFALGEIQLAIGKIPEAAQAYSNVVKKYGNTYEALNAHLRLGLCEAKLKKHLNAIDHFAVVKKKGPKVLRAEAELGWAYSLMALGDHQKAESMIVDLLQSYPSYKKAPSAVLPLGLFYLEKNRLKDALETFALLPDDLGAQYYRGVTLKKQGQIIAASQSFKDIFDADPTGFWADKAQLQIAEGYYQEGELNLAFDGYRKIYEKYLTSDLRPYALHRMACIHFQLGQVEQANQKWIQLIQTFSDDVNMPNGIYMLGEMALHEGDLGKAMAYFGQIKNQNGLRMDAQFKIVWCLAAQKQDEMAVAKATQFLKEYPWGELAAKTHLIKGISLQRMNKFKDANVEYQTVLDHFGNSIHAEKALYLMATALFENNQLGDIVTSLNSTLKTLPVSPSRWQSDTYFWIAESYYGLKQYDDATRTYRLIVDNYKDSPEVPDAMVGLAASLAQQGNYDEAGAVHEKALALAETNQSKEIKRSVLLDTAQVFFSEKKYEKAMGYFNDFIDRYSDDPMVPTALFQLGTCFYRLEYYTEALKRWERIVNTYPKNELAPKALFQIGTTQFGMGDYNAAAATIENLIQKYPTFDKIQESRILVAQAYYNGGKLDVAIKLLQNFLNTYPKDPKAKDVLELLQMANYRASKGEADLMALTEKYPKSKLTADIYWQTGAEAYNAKQYKKALEFFRKLVGDFPDSPQVEKAYFYMAESYLNIGDFANAASAYKSFTSNFPNAIDHVQGLFRLGVSYFQNKNYSDAVVAFNNSYDADPKGSWAHDSLLNIALCYKNLNQPAQAYSAYDRLLHAYPADLQRNKITLQMGDLKNDLKNYEEAIKIYGQVDSTAPESFQALVAEAKIYKLLKNPEKELSTYEKVLAKRPYTNEVRLASLVTLAEIYQDNGRIKDAVAVYQDIMKNSTNPEWRNAARDRAQALQSELPSKQQP